MRILLDECLPVLLGKTPAFDGHDVRHVARCGLAGLGNGDLRQAALGKFDVLFSSDLHFKSRSGLAPAETLGVVVIRVTPNVLEFVQPAIEALAAAVDLNELVGKLTIVWRDRWEIR